MTGHISSVEAKTKALPGHDTFRASHSIYHDEISRDGGIFALCVEAFKAFNDSIMVSERQILAYERLQDEIFIGEGRSILDSPLPANPMTWKWIRLMNLEHLKIASGFEIIIKSMLVEKGILIQEIKSDRAYKILAIKQRKSPVYAKEIRKIKDFRFDGSVNYLPGLTRKSIGFQTVLKEPNYRSVLDISDMDLELIDEFRNLRNEIHFPTDAISAPVRAAYPIPISDFLVNFINEWIVDRGNLISDTRGLRQRWQHLI